MTNGSVCAYVESSVRESSHHFAAQRLKIISKELTSKRYSSEHDRVELQETFFEAVDILSLFVIFVVLVANLVLRLLLDGCTTTLLVVAPVEELYGFGREDNAH